MLCVVRCGSLVAIVDVRCVLSVVCWLLFVVCCFFWLVFVVCCWLVVDCCMLVDLFSCSLLIVRCVLVVC